MLNQPLPGVNLMCYAIPAKILEVYGAAASVDFGGVKKRVNISLVENPKIGDYVLVHAGFAIEKMSEQDASESLKIIRDMMDAADGR